MIATIQRETIVDMLLNSLEAERHVRGPLLFNLLDELSARQGLEPAADVARELLEELQHGTVCFSSFALRIAELRELIWSLSPRISGVVSAGRARRDAPPTSTSAA